jgi:hypothetical protein
LANLHLERYLKGNLAGPGHNCGHYNYLYHDIYVLHVHHAYDVLYLLPKEGLFKRIICIDVIRHNFIALLKVKKRTFSHVILMQQTYHTIIQGGYI